METVALRLIRRLGVASDMIVACGGTTILGRNHRNLRGRATSYPSPHKTPAVADKLIERIKWWEWYSGVFGATWTTIRRRETKRVG